MGHPACSALRGSIVESSVQPEEQGESSRRVIKPTIWEKQPLGLALFAVLFVVFAAPGLVTILIACNLQASKGMLWQIVVEAIFAFAAVSSLLIMTGFVSQRPLSEVGIQPYGIVRETMTGILIGAALISVVIGLLGMSGHFHILRHNVRYVWQPAALLCFLIALSEECVYRGYMLPAFERRWGTGTALIVSSLLFGAMHIVNVRHEHVALQLRVTLFMAIEAGLLLGASYLATRRLWLPIGIHWAWNFFLGPYYGAPVSGPGMMGSYSLSQLSGPSWMTGGKFGPEAGVILLAVCTTATLAMLIVVARRREWRLAPS